MIPLLISACSVLRVGCATPAHALHRSQKSCFWAGWSALAVALYLAAASTGRSAFLGAHGAARNPDAGRGSAAGSLASAGDVSLGAAVRMAPGARPMGQNRLRPPHVEPSNRPVHRLVDSRRCNLDLARSSSCFNLTLTSELAHTAQHLSFFLRLYSSGGRCSTRMAARLRRGVFYVFTTAVHTSILGALLTFAPHVWYPAYSYDHAGLGIDSA